MTNPTDRMGDIVLQTFELGFPWQTLDPFLFCVHHLDRYPKGNASMGPDASLAGRNLGMDFEIRDGWRMYHGRDVPGFPAHPHRGFETITIARQGFIDHHDSLGAKARFGEGDVQWMTAGRGVVHSEMFPLLDRENPNTGELFQIWLNLPREDKKKDAYFTMFWRDEVPRRVDVDDAGRETEIVVVAGAFAGLTPPQPPPSSWASRPDSDVAVWTLAMAPNAEWTAPPARAGTNRVFYFFDGTSLRIADATVAPGNAARVRPDAPVALKNGPTRGQVLVLQGKPINEPVVQHGPFVMNTADEIRQTMVEYQQTGFGGWPHPSEAPVHPRDAGRFAVHADGREERPG